MEIVVGVFGLRAGPTDVWYIYRKKMNFTLNPHFSQDDCAHPFIPPSTKCSFVEEASPRCFHINRIICEKNNATGRWYGFGPGDRNCTSRYLAQILLGRLTLQILATEAEFAEHSATPPFATHQPSLNPYGFR